jgi:hypothetical protein
VSHTTASITPSTIVGSTWPTVVSSMVSTSPALGYTETEPFYGSTLPYVRYSAPVFDMPPPPMSLGLPTFPAYATGNPACNLMPVTHQ